jgi:hypothetical protein
MNKLMTMFVALLALNSLCRPTLAMGEEQWCKNWLCFNPTAANNCGSDGTCSRMSWTDLSGNALDHGDEWCDPISSEIKNFICAPDVPPTISAWRVDEVCGCDGNTCDEDWVTADAGIKDVNRVVGQYCPWSPAYTTCQLLLHSSTWPGMPPVVRATGRETIRSFDDRAIS